MSRLICVGFSRYRGLKSYRTSPWDPKENLPGDYARIFQFDNFKRTSKRVLTGDDDLEGTIAVCRNKNLKVKCQCAINMTF